MVEKSLGLMADSVIYDLEDAVPISEKQAARDILRAHLAQVKSSSSRIYVRVNKIVAGMVQQDLAVVSKSVMGVVQPKVSAPEDILMLSEELRKVESHLGLKDGCFVILPMIESALGVLNAYPIASSSPRVKALLFGAEDFTLELGAKKTDGGDETRVAKSLVAIAAAAAEIQAIDCVYPDVEDTSGLVREAEAAKVLGFKGKQVIHPRQVEPVNRVFAPSEEEIREAKRVVDAYEDALRRGLAVVALDGKMVEPPVAERARRLLELADYIASKSESKQA